MTEEKVTGRIAIARSISLTPQEWKDLADHAREWRTSRSGAFRRIWLEWRQKLVDQAAGQAGQDGTP